MRDSATWVLVSRCAHCGGGKTRPSLTAFVYCDYCGALSDFDFRKACEQPAQLPGPAYEALLRHHEPALAKALRKSENDRYRQLQTELFDAWVTACPLSCPPRIKHADYRARYVEHLAAAGTAAAFDPQHAALQQSVNNAVAGLRWTQTASGPRVAEAGLRVLLDAVIAQQTHLNRPVFLAELPAHPDRVDGATLQRIALSTFVQGWLPYLAASVQAWAIERCGFSHEYIQAQPPARTTHCACCGAELPMPDGAHCAVCEYCGNEIALTHRLDCDGCGAALSLPRETYVAFDCPQCRRRIEPQGSVWQDMALTNPSASPSSN
jgi:hypothetical protein